MSEPIQFKELPNHPSAIESAPGAAHPLNEVVKTRSNEGNAPLQLEVLIRDVNLDHTLRYEIYVNERLLPVEDFSINPTGTFERPFVLNIPRSEMRVGECNKVELYVSTAFKGLGTRNPVDPKDLSTATWWVAIQDSAAPMATTVDMFSCADAPRRIVADAGTDSNTNSGGH